MIKDALLHVSDRVCLFVFLLSCSFPSSLPGSGSIPAHPPIISHQFFESFLFDFVFIFVYSYLALLPRSFAIKYHLFLIDSVRSSSSFLEIDGFWHGSTFIRLCFSSFDHFFVSFEVFLLLFTLAVRIRSI